MASEGKKIDALEQKICIYIVTDIAIAITRNLMASILPIPNVIFSKLFHFSSNYFLGRDFFFKLLVFNIEVFQINFS